MENEMKQSALAEKQFGSTAASYLTSAVHAQGADLEALKKLIGRIAASSASAATTVLDLGCGGGHVSFAVAPLASSVTACDLSAQMLEVVAAAALARNLSNIRTECAAAEKLPFADASFDIVITRFSAHHWSDVRAGLCEAHRVLKAGGRMIVIDIVAPEQPLLDTVLQSVEILRDASHVRDYRISEWSAMLSAAGFVVRDPVPQWRLKMVFADWIARMRTPAERVTAIRSLFDGAAEEVRHHFAVEADYSFTIASAFFEAVKS
jgi:ubiquinone/menaquinone biosynthesis C-methylase UbiE